MNKVIFVLLLLLLLLRLGKGIESIETNRSEQPHEDPVLSDPACQADDNLQSENSVHASPIVPTAYRLSLAKTNPCYRRLIRETHHQPRIIRHPRTAPPSALTRT